MIPCSGHSAAGWAGLGAGAHLGHAVVGPEVPGDDVVSAAAPLLPAQQLPGLTRQRGLTRPPLFTFTLVSRYCGHGLAKHCPQLCAWPA